MGSDRNADDMNGSDKPVAQEGDDEDDSSEKDGDQHDVEPMNLFQRLLLLKCFQSAKKNNLRL